MDSRGNIHQLPADEYIALRKLMDEELVPIADAELPHVRAMNRHDRRAWYAVQRKKARADAKSD